MAVITGFDDVADRLEGSVDKDQISGLSGNDTLIGGAERDTLLGGAGDDILQSAGFAGGFASKSQNDVLSGGGGVDVAQLDYSDLVFVGSEKPIALTFTFAKAAFQIQIDGFVGATIDSCERIEISMADGADFASGGELNDYIDANGGDDTVNGRGGDDFILDSGGKASLDGGGGTDTLGLELFEETKSISFDLAGGDIVRAGKQAGNAVKFEILRASTGSGNDTISGGGLADDINVRGGNNVVNARGGNDTVYSFEGRDDVDAGSGNDRIATGAGNDTIDAGDGNDFIEAGAGNDKVEGGAGNDVIKGSDSFTIESDTLDGGAGDDNITVANQDGFADGKVTAIGGSGADTLTLPAFKAAGKVDLADGSANLPGGGSIAGFEIFNLRGSLGDDTIISATGADTLDGSNGDDLVVGGGGNDTIYGNNGSDTLSGGDGNDHLYATYFFLTSEADFNSYDGGAGNDTIDALGGDDAAGGAGVDLLSYGTSNTAVELDFEKALIGKDGPKIVGFENFYGTNQGDKLSALEKGGEIDAGFGDDTIVGRDGDDTIEGSVGADTITLGKGDDTLLFFSLGDRITSDVVKDFNVKDDQIQLDAFSRIIPAGVMTDEYFTKGDFDETLPTASKAHAEWFYDKSSGELFLDWDGTGATYQTLLMATFTNKPDLEAKDFFISLIG